MPAGLSHFKLSSLDRDESVQVTNIAASDQGCRIPYSSHFSTGPFVTGFNNLNISSQKYMILDFIRTHEIPHHILGKKEN